jgi:hypothetical protein
VSAPAAGRCDPAGQKTSGSFSVSLNDSVKRTDRSRQAHGSGAQKHGPRGQRQFRSHWSPFGGNDLSKRSGFSVSRAKRSRNSSLGWRYEIPPGATFGCLRDWCDGFQKPRLHVRRVPQGRMSEAKTALFFARSRVVEGVSPKAAR